MERPEEPVTLVRLGGTGGARRSWLAVGLVVATAGALIGIGALNRAESAPERTIAPTLAASAPGATPSAIPTAAPSATVDPAAIAPETDVTVTDSQVQILSAGYVVAYLADATHQPAISDGGALAIFGFGDRNADGGDPDLVSVSVGTPAKGALIPTNRRFPRVYGGTLDDLQIAYADATGVDVTGLEDVVIDGQIARRLLARGGTPLQTSVAIAHHGNRAFVFAATSIDVLQAFLRGFRFGPSLFVSERLGFQVPQFVGSRPFGTEVGVPPGPVAGLFVFDDGSPVAESTFSHVIGVSVGTETQPAPVRVLPSGRPPPEPRRIWGATLTDLWAAYLAAAGPGISVAPTTLGGEAALLVLGADGLAAMVLAVHEGRAYLVMTSGRLDVEAAPHFQTFLDAFAFL